MGIYDREYYRREGPSFLESFSGRGRVCKWLILINVGVFVLQLATWPGAGSRGLGPVTDLFELDPAKVLHGEVWRLMTFAFLHDVGIWHILFNMLFLWWFGSELEERYGSREFLAFYLTGTLVAGLGYCGWELARGTDHAAIGASGGVTAVLVLFALLYPHRRILFWFVIPIPIWFFVAFQVLQDSYIFASGRQNGVAVVAHLAGAAFGLLYFKGQFRLVDLLPDLRRWRWRRRRAQPRLRVYREQDETPTPVAVPAAPAQADVDEQLEAKLDAILEKVSRTGRDSLSESERELLLRASEIYRRRRS